MQRLRIHVCVCYVLWEGRVVVIPFFKVLQLGMLAKLWWHSGEFWWGSGEIMEERAKQTGNLHKNIINSAFPHYVLMTISCRSGTATEVLGLACSCIVTASQCRAILPFKQNSHTRIMLLLLLLLLIIIMITLIIIIIIIIMITVIVLSNMTTSSEYILITSI